MGIVDDWEDIQLQDPISKVVHKAKKAPPFANIRWVTSCGKQIKDERVRLKWLAEKIARPKWKEVEGKTITCLKCRKNGKQVNQQNDR